MIAPTSDDELAIPTDDPQYNTCEQDKIQDTSGAASENDITSSADLSDGYKAIDDPQVSESLHDSSLHSRDTNTIHSENQRNGQKKMSGDNHNEESPMDLGDDSNKTNENKGNGKTEKKSRGYYYNPLVYHTSVTGKTYYYQYFKPYSHDHRMLKAEQSRECHCPKGKIHHFNCPWYNPDIIYILDTKGDLSTSEQAAQQKIYNMYQNTKNSPPENCGCGTKAVIAYMGHNTSCVEFLHIHERESYEVLLAILKKRKKVTFHWWYSYWNKKTQIGFNSGNWMEKMIPKM